MPQQIELWDKSIAILCDIMKRNGDDLAGIRINQSGTKTVIELIFEIND